MAKAKMPKGPTLAQRLKKAEGLDAKFETGGEATEAQAIMVGLQLYGLVESVRKASRNPIHKSGVRADVLHLDAIGFEILRVLDKPHFSYAHEQARRCSKLFLELSEARERGADTFQLPLSMGTAFGVLLGMCGPLGASYLAQKGSREGNVLSKEVRKKNVEKKKEKIKKVIRGSVRGNSLTAEARKILLNRLEGDFGHADETDEEVKDHYSRERLDDLITEVLLEKRMTKRRARRPK